MPEEPFGILATTLQRQAVPTGLPQIYTQHPDWVFLSPVHKHITVYQRSGEKWRQTNYTGKRPQTVWVRLCVCVHVTEDKVRIDMSPQPHCRWKSSGKMPRPRHAPLVLCQLAQSKCTWTCHKCQFLQKFTSKRPQTKSKPNSRRTFCASLRCRNAYGQPSYARIYKKKAAPQTEAKITRQTL